MKLSSERKKGAKEETMANDLSHSRRRAYKYPRATVYHGSHVRSQAWALGGLSRPKQKYSLPNEMKTISPFGIWLKFLARFVAQTLMGYRAH